MIPHTAHNGLAKTCVTNNSGSGQVANSGSATTGGHSLVCIPTTYLHSWWWKGWGEYLYAWVMHASAIQCIWPWAWTTTTRYIPAQLVVGKMAEENTYGHGPRLLPLTLHTCTLTVGGLNGGGEYLWVMLRDRYTIGNFFENNSYSSWELCKDKIEVTWSSMCLCDCVICAAASQRSAYVALEL